MSAAGMTFLDDADALVAAMSPPRPQLLALLREPASATQLGAALGLPRQRVNYHLRALEGAGLIALVEERQRRGCVERIMQATAGSFVVDPSIMNAPDDAPITAMADRYASEHCVAVAAGTVRDVARMQEGADRDGTRLLTFTIEAEIRFAAPGDVHDFTDAVMEALADAVAAFDTVGGRPYRLVAAGHPAPRRPATEGPEQ